MCVKASWNPAHAIHFYGLLGRPPTEAQNLYTGKGRQQLYAEMHAV